jgi:FtsP/CotA-like multicopper oxidase with cupredoxin domain
VSGEIVNQAISQQNMNIGEAQGNPITIKGHMPEPLIRRKEGQVAKLNVTNHLKTDPSIHWHDLQADRAPRKPVLLY